MALPSQLSIPVEGWGPQQVGCVLGIICLVSVFLRQIDFGQLYSRNLYLVDTDRCDVNNKYPAPPSTQGCVLKTRKVRPKDSPS